MATYSSPYKSGTITSVSGNTIVVGGISLVQSDVGRILIMTNGPAVNQHRRILAISGNNVTIEHPMDAANLLGTTDVLPNSGNQFAVSYRIGDLVSSDVNLTLSNSNVIKMTTMALSGGAFIHAEDYHIEFNSDQITIGNNSGFIFGYYGYIENQDLYTTNSCSLVDIVVGAGGDQLRQSATSFGMFDIYGGTMSSPGGCFWRAYAVAPSTNSQIRWIDCAFLGSFGSRTDGPRSVIKAAASGATTTLGVSNPRSAVARVELEVFNSDQCLYVWLAEGASGRGTITRAVNIGARILRLLTSGSDGSGQVYEIVAPRAFVDAAPALAVVEGSNSLHTIRYGNIVRVRFIRTDTSPVTVPIKTSITDVGESLVNSQTLTGGDDFDEVFLRHTDIPSTAGTKTLASGTSFSPYEMVAFTYENNVLVQALLAEDLFASDLTLIPDPTITNARAVTQALTSISSAEEFYDRAKLYAYDSFTSDSSLIATRQGDTIDLGARNLVLTSAGSVFSVSGNTITARASTLFSGSITTTGTISVAPGITLSGTYTDASGTTTALTLVNVVIGSQVLVRYTDNGQVIINQEALSSTLVIQYVHTTDREVIIRVRKASAAPFFIPLALTTTLTAQRSSLTINQLQE